MVSIIRDRLITEHRFDLVVHRFWARDWSHFVTLSEIITPQFAGILMDAIKPTRKFGQLRLKYLVITDMARELIY